METISTQKLYSVSTDKSKNRITLAIHDHWVDIRKVPDYFKDLEKALETLKPGFTALIDIRDMEPPSYDDINLHRKAYLHLRKTGLKKLALVVPANPGDKVALIRFVNLFGDEMHEFTDEKSAKEWLG
jgi:hypothetical protein